MGNKETNMTLTYRNSNNIEQNNNKMTKRYFNEIHKVKKKLLREYNSNKSANSKNEVGDIEVNWFNILYDYFSTINDDWAIRLVDWMENESFLYENMFQSISFYYLFKNEYEPKCFLEGEKYIENEIKKQINRISLNISNKLGGSITVNSISDIDELRSNFIYSRSKTKELVKVLKNYLNNENHPLNMVINKFGGFFGGYINQIIKRFKNDNNLDANSLTSKYIRNYYISIKYTSINEELISDIEGHIKEFIRQLEISLKNFYFKITDSELEFENGDIQNLLFLFLFKNKIFSKNLYILYKTYYKSNIQSFSNKVQQLINYLPEDFEVHPKFCLDDETKNKYELTEDMKEKLEITENGTGIIIEKDQEHNYCKNDDVYSDIFEDSESVNGTGDEIPYELNNTPYNISISCLRNMKNYNSPIEKLTIVTNIRKKILSSINSFWDNYRIAIKKQKKDFLSIDNEELMKIFTFIVVKANYSDIIIDRVIINQFIAEETKKTMFGYYSSYIDVAISKILGY